jgi:translation initiation factor IF-3
MFRGREMAHTTHGRALLDRILADLQNDAAVEQSPRMEGRNMTMMLGAKVKEVVAKK